jgi:hypothetical protein
MTFDEIFQQYVAQGFTKPTAGVAGIETLMPTTATVAPIVPVQKPQQTGGGRDNDYTNIPDTTTNAGITSFSEGIQSLVDLYSQIPTPMNLAIKAIQNIQNPNLTMFGQPTEAYQTQLEKMAQKKLDFQQFTGGSGSNGGHPGGAAAAAGAAAQAADDAAAGAGGY